MRKAMIVAGILSLSFGAAIPAHARNAPQDTAAGVSTDFHGVDALIRKQLVRERLSNVLPPIRSRDGFAAFVRVADAGHPLHRLSPAARERFVHSLTFNQNGLTGYRADDLLAELSASEIYQVLSVLGAQHSAPFLHKARVVDELDRMVVQASAHSGCRHAEAGLTPTTKPTSSLPPRSSM